MKNQQFIKQHTMLMLPNPADVFRKGLHELFPLHMNLRPVSIKYLSSEQWSIKLNIQNHPKRGGKSIRLRRIIILSAVLWWVRPSLAV